MVYTDIYSYLRVTARMIGNSRFGNKMALKGGTVLVTKMLENNRYDLVRLTQDLDIHCSDKNIWVDFYNNIEDILNQNDYGLQYKIVDRRSIKKGLDLSDSLKFELLDRNNGSTVHFKIDMNIKPNSVVTFEYNPNLNMTTYDAITMMTDKIHAISSEKIFRRIKDLYDISVLASLYDFSYLSIKKHIEVKFGSIENLKNMLTSTNIDGIIHAYEKYNAFLNEKPDIRIVWSIVEAFVKPFYCNWKEELTWNHRIGRWV